MAIEKLHQGERHENTRPDFTGDLVMDWLRKAESRNYLIKHDHGDTDTLENALDAFDQRKNLDRIQSQRLKEAIESMAMAHFAVDLYIPGSFADQQHIVSPQVLALQLFAGLSRGGNNAAILQEAFPESEKDLLTMYLHPQEQIVKGKSLIVAMHAFGINQEHPVIKGIYPPVLSVHAETIDSEIYAAAAAELASLIGEKFTNPTTKKHMLDNKQKMRTIITILAFGGGSWSSLLSHFGPQADLITRFLKNRRGVKPVLRHHSPKTLRESLQSGFALDMTPEISEVWQKNNKPTIESIQSETEEKNPAFKDLVADILQLQIRNNYPIDTITLTKEVNFLYEYAQKLGISKEIMTNIEMVLADVTVEESTKEQLRDLCSELIKFLWLPDLDRNDYIALTHVWVLKKIALEGYALDDLRYIAYYAGFEIPSTLDSALVNLETLLGQMIDPKRRNLENTQIFPDDIYNLLTSPKGAALSVQTFLAVRTGKKLFIVPGTPEPTESIIDDFTREDEENL